MPLFDPEYRLNYSVGNIGYVHLPNISNLFYLKNPKKSGSPGLSSIFSHPTIWMADIFEFL